MWLIATDWKNSAGVKSLSHVFKWNSLHCLLHLENCALYYSVNRCLLLSPRILISHLRREICVIFQNWMSFLQLTGDKVKARRSKSLDKTATWVQAQNEALTTSSDRSSNQTQTESVSRRSNQMQTEVCCQRSFIQRVYRKICKQQVDFCPGQKKHWCHWFCRSKQMQTYPRRYKTLEALKQPLCVIDHVWF